MGGMLIVDTKFVRETNLEGSIRQTFISSLGKWNWLYINHLIVETITYQSVVFIYIGFLEAELNRNYHYTRMRNVFKSSFQSFQASSQYDCRYIRLNWSGYGNEYIGYIPLL